MRTKAGKLTIYSDTTAPLTIATRQVGEWHMHQIIGDDGEPWRGSSWEWWTISHASGLCAWGPTNSEQRAREVLAAFATLSPCPASPDEVREVSRGEQPRSTEMAEWVKAFKFVQGTV